MAELTPTKDPERAVTSINDMPPPLTEKPKRPINPYSLKRSKRVEIRITDFPAFVKMVNGHVNTILTHDPGQKSTHWYSVWKQWIEDDLLQATTFHMISVVVDFPPTGKKTHKTVSRFILEQLTVLDRYLEIPFATKHDDPLVKISAPYIYANTQTDTKPDATRNNNPFAILEQLEDEPTIEDTPPERPIEELIAETEVQSLSAIEQLDEMNEMQQENPTKNQESGVIIAAMNQDCVDLGNLIDGSKDSSSQSNSLNNVTNYWDLKQKEFDAHFKAQQATMDRQQQIIDESPVLNSKL